MNMMAKITVFSSLVVSFVALSCSLFILSKDMEKKPDVTPALKKQIEEFQTKNEEQAKRIETLEKKSETLNNTLKELKIIGEDVAKQPQGPAPTPPVQPVTPPAGQQPQQPAQPQQPVTPPATEVKADANAKKITIQVAALNMRDTPSTNGDVTTVLKKNQKVTLMGDKKEANGHTWVKVKTEDGAEGWIAESFAN